MASSEETHESHWILALLEMWCLCLASLAACFWAAATGQPDSDLWVFLLEETWPRPLQPGVGHLRIVSCIARTGNQTRGRLWVRVPTPGEVASPQLRSQLSCFWTAIAPPLSSPRKPRTELGVRLKEPRSTTQETVRLTLWLSLDLLGFSLPNKQDVWTHWCFLSCWCYYWQ